MCHGSVFAASFAACAVCFSLRAMFRVCHDFDSVFGFGFSFLRDSRFCAVVVGAMYPLSALSEGQAVTESEPITSARRTFLIAGSGQISLARCVAPDRPPEC